MIDPQLLRKDLNAVIAGLARRHYTLDGQAFAALEGQRKAVQVETETLQSQRNALSKQIGVAKGRGESAEALMAQVNEIARRLEAQAQTLESVQARLNDWLLTIPNIPHESVPTGKDSDQNQEVRRWGSPRDFAFEVKDHVDVGAA
jgi:seryl-tRNA synthetase